MDLANVLAKLTYLQNLVESEGPKRTVLAEIGDLQRIIIDEQVKMSPFPITCECSEKGTPRQHKQTSQHIAEQAYANYARYHGRSRSLGEIKNDGGFGCIEIRMLLRGLALNEFAKDTANGQKRLDNFLVANPDIKL
jgi:hypothetical protein